jgi:hypothetical protein
MYKHLKDNHVFDDYQFSLATGTLLNVLSAILQENYHAIIDRASLRAQDFPHLEDENEKSLRAYLRKIKDALATKTDGEHGNFVCEKEHGDIVKIVLHTERDTSKIAFSSENFEMILDCLKDVIKNDPAYRDDYEAEEKSFKTNIKRSVT